MNMLATLPCPACQSPINVEVNEPQLWNTATVSLLAITHEHPITCAGCLKTFTLGVGVPPQLPLGLAPYEKPSPIIAPPNGFKGN